VDVCASLLAGDSIHPDLRRGALALGASSALLGVALSRKLDEPKVS
jgi:hypothetical protein